jgi:PP-loop superfamily ATP-utilizing enzyme
MVERQHTAQQKHHAKAKFKRIAHKCSKFLRKCTAIWKQVQGRCYGCKSQLRQLLVVLL